MLRAAADLPGPVYLRLARDPVRRVFDRAVLAGHGPAPLRDRRRPVRLVGTGHADRRGRLEAAELLAADGTRRSTSSTSRSSSRSTAAALLAALAARRPRRHGRGAHRHRRPRRSRRRAPGRGRRRPAAASHRPPGHVRRVRPQRRPARPLRPVRPRGSPTTSGPGPASRRHDHRHATTRRESLDAGTDLSRGRRGRARPGDGPRPVGRLPRRGRRRRRRRVQDDVRACSTRSGPSASWTRRSRSRRSWAWPWARR